MVIRILKLNRRISILNSIMNKINSNNNKIKIKINFYNNNSNINKFHLKNNLSLQNKVHHLYLRTATLLLQSIPPLTTITTIEIQV